MMDEAKEYDQRQYVLMRRALAAFERDESNLGQLISTLKSLLCVLRSAQESWKEEFEGEWWTLEQVYSVALDRGQDPMSGENGAMVREAIARLIGLVAQNELRSD